MIIVAFILGFSACLAFCWKRLSESRRAFEAAIEQNKTLREKAERQANTLANIEALLRRAQRGGIFDLGGEAPLPASAEQSARQHFSLRSTARLKGAGISGPSRNGGPVFSGGSNEQ